MMLAYANFYKPDVWLIAPDGRRHHQTSQLESFSQIFLGNVSKHQTEGTQEEGDLKTHVRGIMARSVMHKIWHPKMQNLCSRCPG